MNIVGFWIRNEGQIVGTLGGIIIAFIAAFLTYCLTNLQYRKKEKRTYEGMLYVLNIELYWQEHQFDLLQKTLEKLRTTSLDNGKFVIENRPSEFNLSVIEKCTENLIENKQYKHELVVLLVAYTNLVRGLNFVLDFKNANDLINNLSISNSEDLKSRIDDYFKVLKNEYADKAKPVIPIMRKLIDHELKDYPKEKMSFSEKEKTIILG